MATVTAFITLGSNRGTSHLRYGQATVDNGETTTLAIPNEGRAVVRIGVPTITSGTLTFSVVPYQGATARTLKDSSGNTVTVATSTGGFVVTIPELSGCYSFTIVCGASQGSARVFDVQMVGIDPVPPSSNELSLDPGAAVTANQGTKTATLTNGWLVTPYTVLGDPMFDDTANAATVLEVSPAGTAYPVAATNGAQVTTARPAVIHVLNTTAGFSSVQSVLAAGSAGAQTMAIGNVPSAAAAQASSNATTTAYVASAVVKASAGNLWGFSGYNSKSSAQFIEFFDATAVPADNAQSVLVISVPASSNFSYNSGNFARRFATGIVWANSSTAPLKTIGSADVFLDAQYS